MSMIKELAETCGVSEQAIRKWCARNQVAKDVAQRYSRKTHCRQLTKVKTCCKIVLKLILRLRERRVNMAIETVQEKNKRLTKEVQELKKALADMTDIVINKDKEIDRMRKRAETDFAGSPTYLQMCEKIKRLNAEVTLAEKRIAVLQQRCSEYSQRSAAPDLKHNERGAGRKKALSEDQIAEFEKLLQQGAGEKQLRERFGLSRSSYFLYKKRLAEKQ